MMPGDLGDRNDLVGCSHLEWQIVDVRVCRVRDVGNDLSTSVINQQDV